MADLKAVIATTVIHRALKPGTRGDKSKGIPAVKPEVQIIRPGARFVPKDAAELAELTKAGAIKAVEEPAATMAEAEAAAADDGAPKKSTRKSSGPKKGAAKKTGGSDDDNLV